jgi:hypothetical protein
MNILKKIFQKKEAPVKSFSISGLCIFQWEGESECWVGDLGNYKISISYSGLSMPSDEFLQFIVKNTLEQPNYFENKLVEIKNLAKKKYPNRHEEIERLEPKDIIFQNPKFILIQFFGPKDNEPFWFAELHENATFVGFDT